MLIFSFLKESCNSESATGDLKAGNENVKGENNVVNPSSKRRVHSLPLEPSQNEQTRDGGPVIGSIMNNSSSGFSFIKGGSSGPRGHVTRKETTLEKVPVAEEGSPSDNRPRSCGQRRIRRDGSISISTSSGSDTPKSCTSCFQATSETDMTVLSTTPSSTADARDNINSVSTSNSLAELVPPISSSRSVSVVPGAQETPKGMMATQNSGLGSTHLAMSRQYSADEGVVSRGIPVTVGMNVSRAQPLSCGKKKCIARRVGYRRESDEGTTMPLPSMVSIPPLQPSKPFGEIDSERPKRSTDHQAMREDGEAGSITSKLKTEAAMCKPLSSTNTLKTSHSLGSACDVDTEAGALSKKFPSRSLLQTGGEAMQDDSVVLPSPVHNISHSPHSSAHLTSQFEPTDSPRALVASESGDLTKKDEEEESRRGATFQQKKTKGQVEGEKGGNVSNANSEKVKDGQLGRSAGDLCMNAVRNWSQEVSTTCRELDTCTTAIMDLTECQVKAMKSEAVAIDELATTEAEQAELAETEDFEAADAMNELVQDKQHAVAEARKVTSSLKVEQEDMIQQLWKYRQAVLTSLKQGKEPVEDAIVKTTEESARVDAEKRAEREALDQCMKEKESRLIMEQSHIDRDITLLQDERQQLESVIDGQTVGEETRRMELDSERAKLEDELTALLEAVRNKREQLKGVEEELVGVGCAVDRVQAKFDRQLQRLTDREHLMCVSMEECESELVAVRAEMEENQAAAQKGKDAQREVAENLEFASTELKASASILEALCSHWETECDSSDEVAMKVSVPGKIGEVIKREDHASLVLALHNAQSALCEMETAVLRNEAAKRESDIEVATILVQLPKLEASKRASIASRGYKEAASLSRQIKAMECRKIKALETIDEISKVDYSNKLKVQQLEVEVAAQALEVVEQKIARLRLERLMCTTECLQIAMNDMRSTYGESLLFSSTLTLLNSESDASISEMTELAEKHSLKPVELHHTNGCDITASEHRGGKDQDRKPKMVEENKMKGGDMEATTQVAGQSIVQKEEIQRLKEELEGLERSLAQAVLDEDFDKAVELDEQIQTMSKTISEPNCCDLGSN